MADGELHRLLVEGVLDYAILALDPGGRILTWNAGVKRLKGYDAEEIVGRHFSVFYPEEVAASGHPERELEIAASAGQYREEGWRVRKDGSRFWADVLITALRDDRGDLVGFAKVSADLTERKRTEEALRESEERFELLVRSVVDYAIFMLDLSGRVESWNRGAERIHGYSSDEVLGRHFSIFYPPDEFAAGKAEEELRVAAETGRFEEEGWRARKNGDLFWANVVLTALRNRSGEHVGFAKVTRDLTELRAAQERAIEDARRVAEAEAESRAKSEFVATVSHELRTPLNAIAGYTQLLTEEIHGPLNRKQEEALRRVQSSQRLLLSLINDLLDFSRMEAGRIIFDLADVRIGELVEGILPIVESIAAGKDLSLDVTRAAGDVVARADPVKVEQILLNLLTNAFKYTPPGGHVVVRYAARADEVVVEVEDDGIGIPEESREVIFEPFVQVGRALSSSHEGTGLGLTISRNLARGMGGDLEVESEEGAGSIFTLTLPASAGPTDG